MIKEPLKNTRLNPKFKYEVAKKPGGESIFYCFQCGKCTATCPIRRFEEYYKPRHIIRAILLGLRDIILSSDVIWLCAACYSCTERCPQGVKITDIIRSVRNLAVEENIIHPFFKAQGRNIVSFGRIYEDEEFINEQRMEIGLPPISPIDREELSKLLKSTKIKKLLNFKE